MRKKQALFIINPKSGTGRHEAFLEALSDTFDTSEYTYETVFTEYRGHAIKISNEAIGKYSMVVAVGGDGTVNEVGRGLIGSTVRMGIIPIGSGNGLARHLNIPMKPREALQIINKNRAKYIDTGSINGEPFVNVAGVGFDAHIAHLFALEKRRGAIPYAKLATTEFARYKPQNYKVSLEGESFHMDAFLLSFANSAQFGNNAYISPHAIINDGLLDICLMSGFPKVEAGQLAIKLFNKRMDKSKYMKIVRATRVVVESEEPIKAHLDGEPVNLPNKIEIRVHPNSLRMVYQEDLIRPGILGHFKLTREYIDKLMITKNRII